MKPTKAQKRSAARLAKRFITELNHINIEKKRMDPPKKP